MFVVGEASGVLVKVELRRSVELLLLAEVTLDDRSRHDYDYVLPYASRCKTSDRGTGSMKRQSTARSTDGCRRHRVEGAGAAKGVSKKRRCGRRDPQGRILTPYSFVFNTK